MSGLASTPVQRPDPLFCAVGHSMEDKELQPRRPSPADGPAAHATQFWPAQARPVCPPAGAPRPSAADTARSLPSRPGAHAACAAQGAPQGSGDQAAYRQPPTRKARRQQPHASRRRRGGSVSVRRPDALRSKLQRGLRSQRPGCPSASRRSCCQTWRRTSPPTAPRALPAPPPASRWTLRRRRGSVRSPPQQRGALDADTHMRGLRACEQFL